MRLADIVRAFGVEPADIRRLSANRNVHWRVRGTGGQVWFLRRHFAETSGEEVLWEARLLADLAAAGVPVAAPAAPPAEIGGAWWTLYPHVAGRPLAPSNTDERTYRRLGRALAAYHAAAGTLAPRPQRPDWCELADAAHPLPGAPDRDTLLSRLDADAAARLRAAAEGLDARGLPSQLAKLPRVAIHGDFSPWNVLVRRGEISALLDFEMAHMDVAIADLAFARRGSHDTVVWGYLEVAVLTDAELAALDGLWTGAVLFGVWKVLARARPEEFGRSDGLRWNLDQLGKTRSYRPPR